MSKRTPTRTSRKLSAVAAAIQAVSDVGGHALVLRLAHCKPDDGESNSGEEPWA